MKLLLIKRYQNNGKHQINHIFQNRLEKINLFHYYRILGVIGVYKKIMLTNKHHLLSTIFYIVSGLGVILISILTKPSALIPTQITKILGILFITLGMFLIVLSAFFLKNAFFGEIEPVSDVIVKEGPYKYIRHPVYLGMIIAMLGIPIFAKNLLGLIAALLLFIPCLLFRAALEEKAMVQKFGPEWEDYISRTHFFSPF